MKQHVFISILSAGLLSIGATAQAQGNSIFDRTSDIVMEQGFTASEMVAFAKSIDIQNSQVVETEVGDIAVFRLDAGAVFVGTTFACTATGCPGFHFMSFFEKEGTNPAQLDFSKFNGPRPHGNAGYDAESDQFVLQRVVTSFDGVRPGSLEGEFGVFIGYSQAFAEWLTEQRSLISVSATELPGSDAKIDNEISMNTTAEFEADAGKVFRQLMEENALEGDLFFEN